MAWSYDDWISSERSGGCGSVGDTREVSVGRIGSARIGSGVYAGTSIVNSLEAWWSSEASLGMSWSRCDKASARTLSLLGRYRSLMFGKWASLRDYCM